MKTNFNLDLALFFTSLSIILYSCLFSPITNLTIKDEKITEWYKLNKIKEPITKNIKILICGKSKCLVAVEVQPKLMFTNQNLPVIKSNLLTTINNDNYSTF
ncbi:hypothetical protein BSR55_10085 [Acinetobacter bereziniae]|nr:hypothetical protein BSR55_10085 [Acinetobacter bereziniae]